MGTTTAARAGQHLCIGLPGVKLGVADRRLLKAIQPGGIVLFARNVDTAGQLRAFTASLKSCVPVRPLLAMDVECGKVNRLRDVIGALPGIAEIKKTRKLGEARRLGHTIGRALREFGIDLDFAPVLDLKLFDAITDNALGSRCWGRQPATVARWAGAFVDGLESAGVAPCAKHFPGLGGARRDSHEHLPTIGRSAYKLWTEDVRPYRDLLPKLSAIMIGHGHYPAYDGKKPVPASLSEKIVTGLLRKRVGFDGLVVTDDLDMGAISQCCAFSDAVVAAFDAGVDMLMVCHSTEKMLTAHETLTKAIESGRISLKRLAQSHRRIERFRQNWVSRTG